MYYETKLMNIKLVLACFAVLKSDQRKKYCFDESFQNMNFSNDAFQLQTQLNDLKVISRPHTALPVNLSQNSLKGK